MHNLVVASSRPNQVIKNMIGGVFCEKSKNALTRLESIIQDCFKISLISVRTIKKLLCRHTQSNKPDFYTHSLKIALTRPIK
jgi:hypothetical protein